MKFLFVTLFPELIEQVCSYSIVGRGMSAGLLSVSCINPRDFTHDKHRTVDDSPFGGGAGMVLRTAGRARNCSVPGWQNAEAEYC